MSSGVRSAPRGTDRLARHQEAWLAPFELGRIPTATMTIGTEHGDDEHGGLPLGRFAVPSERSSSRDGRATWNVKKSPRSSSVAFSRRSVLSILSIGPEGPVSLPRDSSATLALLVSRGLLSAEKDEHATGRPLVYR